MFVLSFGCSTSSQYLWSNSVIGPKGVFASSDSHQLRWHQFLMELVRPQETCSQPLTLMPREKHGCKVKDLTSVLRGLRLFCSSMAALSQGQGQVLPFVSATTLISSVTSPKFLAMTKTWFKCLEGKGDSLCSPLPIQSVSDRHWKTALCSASLLWKLFLFRNNRPKTSQS